MFQAFLTSVHCSHLWYKLAHRLCLRSEWHNVFLFWDIDKVAMPAKCLLPIFEGRIRKHINDFAMRVDSSFVHAGPLRQKRVRSVYNQCVHGMHLQPLVYSSFMHSCRPYCVFDYTGHCA